MSRAGYGNNIKRLRHSNGATLRDEQFQGSTGFPILGTFLLTDQLLTHVGILIEISSVTIQIY